LAGHRAGSGPLHNGAVVCTGAADLTNGAGPFGGRCAWSDSAGDKIFTNFTGKVAASGAQYGAHNDKLQTACTQQFEYSLTK
jgi:hypothetical protein